MDGDLELQLVEFAPHPVHKAPTYHFVMIHAPTGEALGHINLRVGSTPHIERYAGHVGYGVHLAHRGHRTPPAQSGFWWPWRGGLASICCGSPAIRRTPPRGAAWSWLGPSSWRSSMYPRIASFIGTATHENAGTGWIFVPPCDRPEKCNSARFPFSPSPLH